MRPRAISSLLVEGRQAEPVAQDVPERTPMHLSMPSLAQEIDERPDASNLISQT